MNAKKKMEDKLVIGITLKDKDVEKFNRVKQDRNLSQDAQTVRVLIREAYKELITKPKK